MQWKTPRNFFKPLALDAPAPYREVPVRAERMIHFFAPHVEKMRARVPQMIEQVDVLLGNLEDGIPFEEKDNARKGFIEVAKANDFGDTGLWTRVNCFDSPWILDDMTELMGEIGDKLDVIIVPKINGPWDIHYIDQLMAQLEAKYGLNEPILIHVILETAEGVRNVEDIAAASPRIHGMSLGPADLAASRGMKTTRVGGPHPDYGVYEDGAGDDKSRAFHMQDPWHYTVARMVDACQTNGIRPFYGPFGDFDDPMACEAQFRAAFIAGCVGAWTLHPKQIAIAKKVFSPDPTEVDFAKRIIAAMPDGTGAVMVDGKMQDDATWKQAKVMVDAARLIADKEPDLKAAYGF